MMCIPIVGTYNDTKKRYYIRIHGECKKEDKEKCLSLLHLGCRAFQ